MRAALSFVANDLRRFLAECLSDGLHGPQRAVASPSVRHPTPAHSRLSATGSVELPAREPLGQDHGLNRDTIRNPQAEPFQSEPHAAQLFNKYALRVFEIQYTFNQPYRALCDARGILPAIVEHWSQIPAVSTSAFKAVAFSCLGESERNDYFESSGTTRAARSRTYHSRDSLELYRASLLPWFQRHLLPETIRPDRGTEGRRWDFISLTPTRSGAPHSSLVYMLDVVSRQEWFPSASFVGDSDESGAWRLDLTSLRSAVQRSCRQGRTLLLTGTAFNYVHLLEALNGRPLRLPAGSRIMETGGYKGRSRVLSKSELHTELAGQLGVPPHNIVTEYGMTELGSQAYDHVAGHHSQHRGLKFPPWARATVVSCETGLEVAMGDRGLVRIVDLANAFSVAAVETEDFAVRHPDGIELLGRRELAEPRGCSLMAV